MNKVKVYTAMEISEEIKAKIEEFIKVKAGKDYEADYRIQKDLIGGVKIEIGDVVYDGTVCRRLQIIGDKI